MANKSLFQTRVRKLSPRADAVNEAGGKAYQLSPKQALAQYAATGCLNDTFYASAETQLDKVLAFCNQVEPEFIAKTAVYCRERGLMKDMPALLCAYLSTRDSKLLDAVFDRVIDDGKMLRNFVQIMRSGAVGRRSLGTRPKKLVQRWFEKRTDEQIFRSSVGQDPSLADVIRMVHPKPKDASREALYAYLIGKEYNEDLLPELVRQFEAFKKDRTGEVPRVPFQLLTALNLSREHWTRIALQGSWQMIRMNLNTFARHGVFEDQGVVRIIADRLRDPVEVAKAKVFPYQLMIAHKTTKGLPDEIREALQDALDLALANVPRLPGKIYVCPDVSGSMSMAMTGYRRGSTSAVRCIDLAALVAAALLRQNPDTEVLPFENKVVSLTLDQRDSVLTNAEKLARIGGGGTNCSAPLALLNQRGAKGNLVIFVSDNESWADRHRGPGTGMMQEWETFKKRNPRAKLVCIDIQPYQTTQAKEREDILNIGGFSDVVFDLLAAFAEKRLGKDHWVGQIESIRLT